MVTFVNFKKTYNSVDQDTLTQIMKQLGLDNKTRVIIQQTLNDTTSKVRIRGEISVILKSGWGVQVERWALTFTLQLCTRESHS